MVERVDSVHIKIRIDVDEEDIKYTQQLASNLEKTSQLPTERKRKIIPRDDPTEVEIKELQEKNKEIRKDIKDFISPKAKKNALRDEQDRLIFERWKKSGLGKFADLSEDQIKNMTRIATNPTSFIGEIVAGTLSGSFGKILKGKKGKAGIILALIPLIAIALTTVIETQMQPGRLLDRRFERIAQEEVMSFYQRTLQEELRHGYAEMRVTTVPGLRGGAGQVNGNLFEFSSGAVGGLQSSPYRSSQTIIQSQAARGQLTNIFGLPRSRIVTSPGVFGG